MWKYPKKTHMHKYTHWGRERDIHSESASIFLLHHIDFTLFPKPKGLAHTPVGHVCSHSLEFSHNFIWCFHNNPIHISFLPHMFFFTSFTFLIHILKTFPSLCSTWLTLLWGLCTLTKSPMVLLFEYKWTLPLNSPYASYCATTVLNSETTC